MNFWIILCDQYNIFDKTKKIIIGKLRKPEMILSFDYGETIEGFGVKKKDGYETNGLCFVIFFNFAISRKLFSKNKKEGMWCRGPDNQKNALRLLNK